MNQYMEIHPCAKINLGLNIVERRADDYHNLETVFMPIPWFDTISISPLHECLHGKIKRSLIVTGNDCDGCPENDNLVVKAYDLLDEQYDLPPLRILLHKTIPSRAGLGGGSSDAAHMLVLLNRAFGLGITSDRLEKHAALLGSDCPFFIKAKPAYAEGKGERLQQTDVCDALRGMFIVVVKPPVNVSTKEAFAHIEPTPTKKNCETILRQPIDTWQYELTNDFEKSVFESHPELAVLKNRLLGLGAVYAQMSGSGSAIYGLFKKEPTVRVEYFPGCIIKTLLLG